MKTRVIQDDPDEPPPADDAVDPAQRRRPANLAARMAKLERTPSAEGDLRLASLRRGAVGPQHRSPAKQIVFEISGTRRVQAAQTRPSTTISSSRPAKRSSSRAQRSLPTHRSSRPSSCPSCRAFGPRRGCEGQVAVRSRKQRPISVDKLSAGSALEYSGPPEDALDKVDPVVDRVGAVQ